MPLNLLDIRQLREADFQQFLTKSSQFLHLITFLGQYLVLGDLSFDIASYHEMRVSINKPNVSCLYLTAIRPHIPSRLPKPPQKSSSLKSSRLSLATRSSSKVLSGMSSSSPHLFCLCCYLCHKSNGNSTIHFPLLTFNIVVSRYVRC